MDGKKFAQAYTKKMLHTEQLAPFFYDSFFFNFLRIRKLSKSMANNYCDLFLAKNIESS